MLKDISIREAKSETICDNTEEDIEDFLEEMSYAKDA
jgi:hypothetical protein